MRQISVLFLLALAPYIFAEDRDPKLGTWPLSDAIAGNTDGAAKGFGLSPHIVGGNEAKPHSHPYQVALNISKTSGQLVLCGGVLISPQWVLTAAHCSVLVKGADAYVGIHNKDAMETSMQTRRVVKIVTAQGWNFETGENNIALAKLEPPFNLNENVQTIRLPRPSQIKETLFRKKVVLTGWGSTSDKSETSPVLREVKTTVMINRDCRFRLRLFNLKDFHICAEGIRHKGICRGDGGGPMIMQEKDKLPTVIGVAAFVSQYGCDRQFPSVFTRVDHYLDWIHNLTGIKLRD